MTKRRNPYPGLTRVIDRHGKVRWRFRKKGRAPCYIAGEYGSKEFDAAYQRACSGGPDWPVPSKSGAHGSFDWLIEHYMRTPAWQDIGPVFKKNLGNQIERFRRQHGHRLVKELRREHVELLMSKKHATPSAANELLKLVRRLCRFAVSRRWIGSDPTMGIKKFRTNPDGYHTSTDEEIARFEDFHGIWSKPVLAMRLMLYTGAARQDAARMGWQNVKAGRISYRRQKTGGVVDLPIHPDLLSAIEAVPSEQMLFVLNAHGRPFKPETFGNWFSDKCVRAGITGRAHGLRKAGATRLANAGATEFEVMAFLGHHTPNEARTYVKKASRSKLGDSGMEKLINVSNPVRRLDNARNKLLKRKEK
tara:strand:+ start:31422 stop:32507 length:1086 start_codon:yes stop_codon:yes gene_type:complete